MRIETYEHHGAEVYVQTHLKGKHREHCLCYQGCRRFKPGTAENCHIAQENFAMCVRHSIVAPVYECPAYEPGEAA